MVVLFLGKVSRPNLVCFVQPSPLTPPLDSCSFRFTFTQNGRISKLQGVGVHQHRQNSIMSTQDYFCLLLFSCVRWKPKQSLRLRLTIFLYLKTLFSVCMQAKGNSLNKNDNCAAIYAKFKIKSNKF